jgi:hypothetical protein
MNNSIATPRFRIALPSLFFVAAFALWAPGAEAKVVVQGNREFTDAVNNCFSTYRNTPGLVGDVIKELENSKNEHRIVDDPAWENTPNDAEKAENGTGTGTVSKVNVSDYESGIKGIEELKHKDFCTTLMHELFHAVDADRGQWSQEKVEGIYKDEVEATIFQNLFHALRGVPPRTTYGAADLVKLGLLDAPAAAKKTIQVIPYGGKFLPVDQLIVEDEVGCGADHWHAAQGVVTATDGSQVPDPGPQCGYGRVRDLPAQDQPVE